MDHPRSQLALTHVRLLVTDYRERSHFYRDVLGFGVTWGDADGGYADFDAGESTLAIFDRTAMARAIDVADLPIVSPQQDAVRGSSISRAWMLPVASSNPRLPSSQSHTVIPIGASASLTFAIPREHCSK